ncbi:MAG TPA: lipid A deacylase LpxR family protein [Bacteroidia bacterium]|jgi:lipid A 3-O-deacylase|nr:lipid A deacylase LpxR family protein [Bacteroidia bacterium]
MRRKRLSIILLFVSAFAFSQNDSTLSTRRYFSYTYSNDFFNETDRYYTQGIHPELILPIFRKLPLMKILPKLSKSVNQYGLSGTQDCFTPASIRRDTVLKGDRPYSALIYLGHFVISNSEEKKQRLSSELDLGMMGPCAKCEEEQKGIHKMLVNIQPLGWEYQMSNNFLLNYRMRYEKNIFNAHIVDLTGMTEINAGTIYNNAAVGANLRFGKMQAYFANVRTKKLQFYGYTQGWVKAVGYNATMQGGLFNKSVNTLAYNELSPIVLRGSFGLHLEYKNLGIEYSRIFITREIKTWWAHGWGYINILFYF